LGETKLQFRKITIVAVLILLPMATCTAANAAIIRSDSGDELVVPPDSPARFSAFEQYEVADFTGQFVLTGTYRYGYLTKNPADDATYGELDLYFVPDRKFAATLPYWRRRGKVSEVHFKNDKAFVKAVISNDVVMKLRRKKIFSTSGRASIWVENYQAWLECDSPNYAVRFISLHNPQAVRLSQNVVAEDRC
jgi:hypothetical protein